MTIDEFMQDIAPKMRLGWVAMDEDKAWCWFCDKPILDKKHEIWRGSQLWGWLSCYEIAPVDDWTQSLRKVGGNG